MGPMGLGDWLRHTPEEEALMDALRKAWRTESERLADGGGLQSTDVPSDDFWLDLNREFSAGGLE